MRVPRPLIQHGQISSSPRSLPLLNQGFVHAQKATYKAVFDTDLPKKVSKPEGIKVFADAVVDVTRLKRPAGYLLLFYPFAFSIAMAVHGNPSTVDVLLAIEVATGYLIACILMRSAGCIVNDLWDRDIDARVERTAKRPIPSGRISLPVALSSAIAISLITLIGGYLLMDSKTLTLCTVFAGASVLYPLSKRFMGMPQLALGSVFSCGALIGWEHLCGELDLCVTLPLYLSCMSWTMVYDTIYAMQDKEDDKRLNVNSTAIYFKDKLREALAFFLVAMSALMALSGYCNGHGVVFYLISVFAPLLIIAVQIIKLEGTTRSTFGKIFASNSYIGILILAGIIADTFLTRLKEGEVPSREKEEVVNSIDKTYPRKCPHDPTKLD